MSFVFTLTATPPATTPSLDFKASPLNMNEPTSLVPLAQLDKKVMDMVRTQVNFGVIGMWRIDAFVHTEPELNREPPDYFIEVLVSVVARATIVSRHKAALELKTLLLMQHVCTFITCGMLDARTVLTAVVYLSDIRLGAFDTGDRVCERLAIGALMVAHKVCRVFHPPTFSARSELTSPGRTEH